MVSAVAECARLANLSGDGDWRKQRDGEPDGTLDGPRRLPFVEAAFTGRRDGMKDLEGLTDKV